MKIKRLTSAFSLMLLPLTVLITVQCRHEASEPRVSNTSRSVVGVAEEKTYSDATLEGRFADDRVVIVLSHAASMNFKKYTPKDFPEIRCTEITDSTAGTMEVVRQQLEAERTKDWKKLEERVKLGMLVDVEKFHRILDLVLPVKSKENVLGAIKLLEKREDVLYAGPDYFIKPCALPDPLPFFYSTEQQTVFESIRLTEAWDMITGYSGIKVGVIDTGILGIHGEFTGRIDTNLSRDYTVVTTGVPPPNGVEDPDGHGTGVSGIITTNGVLISGVCWDLTLVSLRVFDAAGVISNNNASRVRYAVDHATNNSISILNFSAGVLANYTGFNDMYAAIQQYPGLFVAAAGNDGKNNNTNPTFPANFTAFMSNVISVGALDASGNPRADSNYGSVSVDLFAPGDSIYTTSNNTWYNTISDTSAAAPFVTGVAALVKSLHPHMTAQDLKTALRYNVTPLSQPNLCITGGKLNANSAVNYIPMVDSVDIVFGHPGLRNIAGEVINDKIVGKFCLFQDGSWVIFEREISTYPMYNYFTLLNQNATLFPNIPLSPAMENVLIQIGVPHYGFSAGFALEFPAPENIGLYTWNQHYGFSINLSTHNISIYTGRGGYWQTGTTLSTEKSRLGIQFITGKW